MDGSLDQDEAGGGPASRTTAPGEEVGVEEAGGLHAKKEEERGGLTRNWIEALMYGVQVGLRCGILSTE